MDKKKLAYNWFLSGSSGGFQSGYQAILDAGETAPSPAQQIKQNQLYARFNSSGILALTDTWYVLRNDVAGGFWKLNWKTPASFKCTEPAGAVTKTSNAGINGNGTTTYADCNFTPSTQATQLNATTGGAQALFLHTVPTVGAFLSGVRNVAGTNPYTYMQYSGAASFVYRTLDDLAGSTYLGGTPDGSFLYADASQTEHKIWKNGVQALQISLALTLGLPTVSLRIGGVSGSGAGFSNAVIGMQWWGAPLSDAQKLEMYNAWIEYIT